MRLQARSAASPLAARPVRDKAELIDLLRTGTTTGISAHDRALTALRLADPASKADDFNRPGHMVPLRAVAGGVLKRRGHTEASVGASLYSG